MSEMKDYTLTCGQVIDNLLTLADAYEKASAGKAPSGFLFNPTDAAANMKAAVHFIGSFGQQLPRWIPVGERLPDDREQCFVACGDSVGIAWWHANLRSFVHDDDAKSWPPTHWMPVPPTAEATP